MRAWTGPDLPAAAAWSGARAPEVRVHDSSSDALVELIPEGPARLYVCGITPYDATHMGHAATYVAFDLLNRAWRNAGHDVRYVQNVTDVDDPLLERAQQTGENWVALAEREIELFREDMTALQVLPPDAYVGAVEAIPMIVEMIEGIRATGSTYEVDGDLYFSVHADPAFGEVSGWTEAQMLEIYAARGGDPDRAGKKDRLDCLLWQGPRPGEPGWDSALGRGRPGWHVECSAIARHHLGTTIDVQGGGSDLVFPHHEMSAAEAQVVDGRPFARAYVHAGMVALDGEKMSKSKGNLELVSRLRERGTDPRAIRLALLAHHYRSDWEWTSADLEAAEKRLGSWRDACSRGVDPGTVGDDVLTAMATDLDAPAALAAVDAWAAGPGTDADPAPLVAVLDAALGIRL